MSSQTQWAEASAVGASAQRWTRRALWMLAVFAAWFVLCVVVAWLLHAVFGDEPVRGEPIPVESFGSWLTFTLVLIIPLVAGLAMAAYALVREGGRRAVLALILHAGALVLVILPAVVDRMGPPTT